MQTNRLIALILVVVCFISAIVGVKNQQSGIISADRQDYLEVVRLSGPIAGDGGTLAVRNRLLELVKEDRVKGVLLAINSPGGTVGASKELYEAVKQLRETKPVYVSMLDVAASGGYYAASAADKVYANEGTLTGSIGVILSNLNVGKLLDRVGVEAETIKTGPYKDILSPYRKLSEAERQLLQGLAQNIYEKFVADVAQGRKLDPKLVRSVADGRVFTGSQALENKLVDAIGTEAQVETALRSAAREKFGLSEKDKLPLKESPPSLERIFQQFFSSQVRGSIFDLFPRRSLANFDVPVLLMPSWMLPQDLVVYSELGKS